MMGGRWSFAPIRIIGELIKKHIYNKINWLSFCYGFIILARFLQYMFQQRYFNLVYKF